MSVYTTVAQSNSCSRDRLAAKPKCLLCSFLQKKFADSYSKIIITKYIVSTVVNL